MWYEEVLPADCLFGVIATERAVQGNGQEPGHAVKRFLEHLSTQASVQIGGNETVGHGLCWWSAAPKEGASHG
jgi:CRISPR-associated protein Cmr4